MKNIKSLIAALLLLTGATAVQAQLQVRNDEFIQIGYEDYRTLSFGIESNTPNNGKYAIEYWQGGLNFWKPWPTPYTANYVLFLRDDNHIGMGTSGSNAYRLDVAGTARSTGWYTTSDKRLKSNINPIEGSLTKLLQLKGVSYQYTFELNKYGDLSGEKITEIKQKTIDADKPYTSKAKQRLGFIAQDLQQVLPEAVAKDEKGFLSVNYSEVVPLLVEAMKEQQAKIDALENALNDLKSGASKRSTERNTTTSSSMLYNNFPNPLGEKTTIQYFLDKNNAGVPNHIYIYNQQGAKVKEIALVNATGKGQVEVNTAGLKAGVYIYTLVSNGKKVASKRMIVSK
ncbi:tail fiber domain-containing protein [Microscilla marina]|uniref:Peptidase S74 domain-containing protein n=1 Tax=Microscilla marina ATCC 23134 TaxID=313606 RepID=A1ZJB8_MICM2|nr:tail fiber domain-containing protein [Microscilla marina]EAY29654.1 conserved hypothetical protein [Microscilla marina ATCC 23134]